MGAPTLQPPDMTSAVDELTQRLRTVYGLRVVWCRLGGDDIGLFDGQPGLVLVAGDADPVDQVEFLRQVWVLCEHGPLATPDLVPDAPACLMIVSDLET